MKEIRYFENDLDGSWIAISDEHLFWNSAITKEALLQKIEKMKRVLSDEEEFK